MPVMAVAGETRLHLYPQAFWLLVLSSVLIAAAGYIINDYFDLNIDQVNKPESIVVQKFIRRRSAIIWHMSFSFIGVLLAFYIGFKIGCCRNFIIQIKIPIPVYCMQYCCFGIPHWMPL